MGQCQSTALQSHAAAVPKNAAPLKTLERNLRPSVTPTDVSAGSDQSSKISHSKLFHFTNQTLDGRDTTPLSPSDKTAGTTPETPSVIQADDELSQGSSTTSMLSRMAALTTSLSQQSLKEEDYEEDDASASPSATPEPMQHLQFVNAPTLRHGISPTDLDQHFDEDMIPEEVDGDAPSDEEESFQREMMNADTVHDWEMEPGAITIAHKNTASWGKSPPRPQSHIKMRNTKRTKPGSIIYHDPPSASVFTNSKAKMPSPASVDPHTVAHFNKLKIQAKLVKQQEKITRRATKFDDRYDDILRYRNLHNDFENIQEKLKTTTRRNQLKRSRSFDLSDTVTWFFDFEKLDDNDTQHDSGGVVSSSMSLLSVTSLESQKRFYEEKVKARRRFSAPGVFTAAFKDDEMISKQNTDTLISDSQRQTSEESKKQRKTAAENSTRKTATEDTAQSLEITTHTKNKHNSRKSASILKFLKEKKPGEKITPEHATESDVVAMTSTQPDTSALGWPLQSDSVDNDYHLGKKSYGTLRIDHSDNVVAYPRNGGFVAGSGKDSNDYNVPRRRRQTLPTSLYIPRPDSPNASVKSTASSISGLSNSANHNINGKPSTLVSEPTAREFSKDKVVMMNADKCIKTLNLLSKDFQVSNQNFSKNKETHLEPSNVASDSIELANKAMSTGNVNSPQPKEGEERDPITAKKFDRCINTMSTQEFLRIASENHSLARRYDAAIADDNVAKRLNFDSHDTVSSQEVLIQINKRGSQLVDVVSQEVDALLARFGHDTDAQGEEKR